jgi:hypothetical protein
MRANVVGSCLAVLVLLQGCTHLSAVRVESGAMKAEGAPYNLTFTQYELTVKRRLTSCFDVEDKPADPKNPKKTPNMKVTTTVEATRKEARDPSEEYVIDFAALRIPFKTTDVAVEYYENGALKSVNATVTDKTGEFLKSTFTAAAKIAMLGTGTGAAEALPDACTKEVQTMVTQAAQSEKDVAAKTAALTRQTEQLEKLQAVAVALGSTRNAAERREFADQVKELYKAKEEVEKEQKVLADLLKKLTFTSKVTWPKDGVTFSGQIVEPLTRNDVKKWGTLFDEGLAKLKTETGVWVLISTESPSAKHVVCGGVQCSRQTPAESATGLKYRLAMPGKLQACSNQSCAGDDVELFNDTGMFSQLGPIMTLPLRNYPFMTQTVVLTMNEAGQPTKIGYKSEAGAEKAMDAVNTFVDEYGKVRQAKKPKSELDLVKDETALLEAKAKLAAAKAALEANPNAAQTTTTEALKADTALLEAELAKLKAQAALDEAKKQGTS